MGTIFISGSYGVGKTTISHELSRIFDIPAFQASELITNYTGEQYGATKHVKNIQTNQDVLIYQVAKTRERFETFILAGHFAIFNKKNEIEKIPRYVFGELGITKIILLEAAADKIMLNMLKRDNRDYAEKELIDIARIEYECAVQISEQIGVPLYIHKMNYLTDVEDIQNYIKS